MSQLQVLAAGPKRATSPGRLDAPDHRVGEATAALGAAAKAGAAVVEGVAAAAAVVAAAFATPW